LKGWTGWEGVSCVTARRWFTSRLLLVSERKVVAEVGSALDGRGREFLALLRDRSVTTIVTEHRDRFARFGAEHVEAVLKAQGRRLLVVDPAEVGDDLVRDVAEALAALCARVYGRRAAASRVARAVAGITRAEP
jgi:predicted site-specific integrase-resolvase